MEQVGEWADNLEKETADGNKWLPRDEVESYLSSIDDELRDMSSDLEGADLSDAYDIINSVSCQLQDLGRELC